MSDVSYPDNTPGNPEAKPDYPGDMREKYDKKATIGLTPAHFKEIRSGKLKTRKYHKTNEK